LPQGIAYNNKDILMKALSQLYQNKSLSVYGLNIPRIKRMISTSYPAVIANELRDDNAFLLEDNTLYIQEYESTIDNDECFIKYMQYAYLLLKQLKVEGIAVKKIVIGVIYTGDILEAPKIWDTGAISVQIHQVFLSNFDTHGIYSDIKKKIDASENLSDEDILRLVVLPLTQPKKASKQKLIEDTVVLAKQIKDEKQQLFAIAGILTATDKFINRKYSDQIKEWIRMTKVARLFEEEKIEAVNKARRETRREVQNETQKQIAQKMLLKGMDYLNVMEYTGLTRDEIEQVRGLARV